MKISRRLDKAMETVVDRFDKMTAQGVKPSRRLRRLVGAYEKKILRG